MGNERRSEMRAGDSERASECVAQVHRVGHKTRGTRKPRLCTTRVGVRTRSAARMYDMQRTSTLGITKFSGRGELKFKHLYDVAKLETARADEKGKNSAV